MEKEGGLRKREDHSFSLFHILIIYFSCRTSAYTMKTSLGKRHSGIGYGKKSSFVSKERVPGPGSYKVKPLFRKQGR